MMFTKQNYNKKKRVQFDKCNICGKESALTWNHVPPKSCFNKFSSDVNPFIWGVPKVNSYDKRHQSGIRYRSICDACNNTIGSKYDLVLEEFTKIVAMMLCSAIELPEIVTIPIQINKVCRAICAHFLAAKNFYDENSHQDINLRQYVLNETIVRIKDTQLLSWSYPYSTVFINKGVVIKSFSKTIDFPDGVVSNISSFPLAYIIQNKRDAINVGWKICLITAPI